MTHLLKPMFKTTAAHRRLRRIVLTTALALSGSGALLAVGGLGLSVAQAEEHGQGHRGHSGGPDAMLGPFGQGRMLDRMLDDVKASDAQRSKIKQIAEEAKKDLQAQREAGRSLHEKSLQILSAPQIDDAAAEGVRQQLLAQHDQVSKRVLQAMLDISRVLTPEQRAQLAQRIKQHHSRDRVGDERAKP